MGSDTHSGRLISPPVRIKEAAVPAAVEPGRVEEPARVLEQGLVGSDAGAGDRQGEGLLQPGGQAGQIERRGGSQACQVSRDNPVSLAELVLIAGRRLGGTVLEPVNLDVEGAGRLARPCSLQLV